MCQGYRTPARISAKSAAKMSQTGADIRILSFVLTLFVSCSGDDVASIVDKRPVAGDYVPLHCVNFTIGDWKHREFYSPQYPNNYPNLTECIQLLAAPKGYRIRLDFKDNFHIESSEECNYDFLEFRNGPFGYSPLLGRYCGDRHPPMLESSSRFLWIRFKSDDTIQYRGFRAAYEFYQPHSSEMNKTSNPTMCRVEVNMSKSEARIYSTDIPKIFLERSNRTGEPIDCTWVIYVPAKHRIRFHWAEYKKSPSQVCEDSFIEVFERTTAMSDRTKRICGAVAKGFKTTSNHVYLRMFAKDARLVPSFDALLNIFVHGPCENQFNCGDNTCINETLVCNGNDNCDSDWDEMTCKGTPEPEFTGDRAPFMTEYHTVILGIVGGAILTIVIIAVCITCHQKRKEEERRRHALKQEERTAIEIEMTNLLNRTSPQGTPRRHVMAEANAVPHAPMVANHVGAIPRVNANHVPTGPSNMNMPRRSNSLHNSRRGSRKNSYGNNLSGHTSDDEMYDHSVDGATFRRYLDVNGYNDEDSSPNPSTHNQIPALVTVERYPSSPRRRSCDDMLGAVGRDKSPSPRPDVVQEEKFVYPDVHGNQLARRLSVDTVKSDKSDVWKPIASTETPPKGSARQHRRQHSFGRATDILNAGPTPHGANYAPNYHKNQNRTHDGRVGRTKSEPERLTRERSQSTEPEPRYRQSRPSPVIAHPSQGPYSLQGPPVYHVADNAYDPRPSRAGRESPHSKQRVKSFKPPPPPRTVTAAGGTPTRQAKSSSRNPDIFYTRPTPSKSAQKQNV